MSQLDYYIILNPIRQGFLQKIFYCIFQQNILWIFCRSVAKLQTFRFTAKLNSLLAVRQDNLAILKII